MSSKDTKCAWLPCRKQLGVMVWRPSKFHSRQFCSEECCKKWMDMDSKHKIGTISQSYRRFVPTVVT